MSIHVLWIAQNTLNDSRSWMIRTIFWHNKQRLFITILLRLRTTEWTEDEGKKSDSWEENIILHKFEDWKKLKICSVETEVFVRGCSTITTHDQ